MLKALELHGFKSFADRTRFEFPPGITVVVGPNGSGKSNVVDAIRWVLGEQSAKSLRGAEMADVIFKGSGTGQRKPANTAEVTIVFDNQQGLLDVDSPEVLVTRRVYRSGEGEYLLNGEPCRLRDVKDLFRGTGVGTDAYSLIEQGKVDTLLQASPRERRAIFEEAAGISRFKAKKIESQRRLERVDQNLLRLSDIVEEVDRRLRSLRNQAGKARRYKEYTDRLQQLRTHVGLTDYREITADLRQAETRLHEFRDQLNALVGDIQAAEHELVALDAGLGELRNRSHEVQQQLTVTREAIAGHEATIELRRQSSRELESEEQRCRTRWGALSGGAGTLQVQWRQLQQDLALAEAEQAEIGSRAQADEERLRDLGERLQTLRATLHQRRQEHALALKTTAALSTQLSGLESELGQCESSIAKDQGRLAQLRELLERAVQDRQQSDAREAELRQRLAEASSQQQRFQANLDQQTGELHESQVQANECQRQLTAATERAKVLDEVEKRLEGIGAGTKDLLAQARRETAGPLADIHGMVADLVEVKVDMAPVIDAALGERAQLVVVAGPRLMRAVASGAIRLRGRVGLVALPTPTVPASRSDESWSSHEGVLGRAADFVHVPAQWSGLVEFLLGSTWVVTNLEVALRLREQEPSRDAERRFVTRAGEVLEANGTLIVGPRQAASGLISRRSELRSLRLEIQECSSRSSLLEGKLAQQQAALTETNQQLRAWNSARKEIGDAYAEAHARAEAGRQSAAQTEANCGELQDQLNLENARRTQLVERREEVLARLRQGERHVQELEQQLGEQQTQLAELDRQRQATEQKATASKIAAAKTEQRVETLSAQLLRCQQDKEERGRSLRELGQQLEHCRQRQSENARQILRASTSLAEAYLEQEVGHLRLRRFQVDEQRMTAAREAASATAKSSRKRAQELEKSQHELQLQAGELKLKRDGVAERLRDDYGVELSSLEDEIANEGERDEIDQEIAELRRKVSNIGAVNMESLAELEELEERYGSLSAQYEDLVQAKDSLERIIQRINTDSRRLFVETLDAIRTSFQTLFRRAFGGGQADIVIEEGEDLLESGIDIVATPPGKHSLNISLLSGGERALTAVTLLMAIFRYRPSPFCVLDEVDGPLDEANIGRFVDVLKEFLERTKIVIVTHSKKTMSAATTLYGVTMQESGVSKRVSVQFSDVSDDGTITENAGGGEEDEAAA